MTYITEAEQKAVFESDLPSESPFWIRWVSSSQFSVARYYGSCTIQGMHYTYHPPTDELIRDDVLKFVTKLRKAKHEPTQGKQTVLAGLEPAEKSANAPARKRGRSMGGS